MLRHLYAYTPFSAFIFYPRARKLFCTGVRAHTPTNLFFQQKSLDHRNCCIHTHAHARTRTKLFFLPVVVPRTSTPLHPLTHERSYRHRYHYRLLALALRTLTPLHPRTNSVPAERQPRGSKLLPKPVSAVGTADIHFVCVCMSVCVCTVGTVDAYFRHVFACMRGQV